MHSEFAGAMRSAVVRYSQVWEDHRAVEEGLIAGPGDDILSITGAGCNVLNLLLRAPRSITALDGNPAQSALLQLKLAGIRCLSYEEFVSLLGARGCRNRLALYARVRPALAAPVREFWDARADAVDDGLIHSGRLERYFRHFRTAQLEPLGVASAVQRLFEFAELEAQVAHFESAVATRAVESAFVSYFGREVMASEGRDPRQFRYVGDVDVGRVFWERFRHACTRTLLRGNFYLEYLLTGRYRDLESGPPYMRRASFAKLKALEDRVVVVTDTLEEFLPAQPAGAFAKANLSNVFEYVSMEGTAALMSSLARALQAGGRLCFWNLLVPRSVPAGLRGRLRPVRDQARALWRRDRTSMYRAFHIQEVLAA